MAKVSIKPYSVYLIRCVENGKVYVGLTSGSVVDRLERHKRQAKSGSQCLIHRAIRKHGFDSFEIDLIASGLTCQEACNLEIKEIASRNAAGDCGYNILAGGQSGKSLRPELTKARRSKAAKDAWAGSEKRRQSIYDPNRLKKISEASKRAHSNLDYRANFLSRHASMVEASRQPEVRARAVDTFKKSSRSVSLICENGMTFDTSADAARWVSGVLSKSCSLSNILACAKGRKKSAYGLKWFLADDDNSDD